MGTSQPKLQIAAFGMEKIVPDRESLGVFTRLLMADPEKYVSPVLQLLSGGLMLGAVFMATDYVTCLLYTSRCV